MRRNNKILLSRNGYKKIFIIFLFLINIFSSINLIAIKHEIGSESQKYIDSLLKKISDTALKTENNFSISESSKTYLDGFSKNINLNIKIAAETESFIISFYDLFNSRIKTFFKGFFYGSVFLKSIFLIIDKIFEKENIVNEKIEYNFKKSDSIKKYLKLKYVFLSLLTIYSGYKFFNLDFLS